MSASVTLVGIAVAFPIVLRLMLGIFGHILGDGDQNPSRPRGGGNQPAMDKKPREDYALSNR